MIMLVLLPLLIVILGASSLPLEGTERSQRKQWGMELPQAGSSRLQSASWNIMKLTQSWPPAVCIYLENDDRKCQISSNITSWVIHGLWPTKSGTEGPNYCNDSWKFNVSEVQSLRPKLDFNWPSITLGEPAQDTWKHEWEKHGTCGASLPAINSQLNYFNVTLGLHLDFNLSKALMQGGVIPSNDREYKIDEISQILQKYLGATPSITCVEDKVTKSKKTYLEQVEVCLSKDFKPVDCESSDSQSHPPQSLHQLLFESETSFQAGVQESDVLKGNAEGCKDSVYYKPMPPRAK